MTEHQPEHQPERALDAADPDDLPEQMLVRRDKRARLLAEGRPPYPVSVARTHSLGDVRARYADLATDRASGDVISVAGRVVFVRIGGKLCFATIQEGDGTRLQVMISLDQVGADSLAAFKSDADLGDFLAVTGEVISSRRGELSVLAREWSVASKALRPLPVLHKELAEESRVRQRYVDLIVRDSARANARRRPAMVRGIRNFFDERGYIEVETPMLQVLHGGANARPFRTHMNAFDMELFLRIAPELFLKRALVGGIERVFEINRNFRNEGADSTHSPEFTMIEAYEAFGDYNTMAQLTQDLVQAAAVAATGSTLVELADGTEYDLGGTWANITMFGSLSAALGTAVGPETPMEHLVQFAEKHEVPVLPHYGPGKLAEELFEALVVPSLYEPTFVRDYPAETSPLTRAHRDTPGLAEKWDLYIRSFELGTGYSELTDPVLQRERFVSQARAIAAGDVEGMVLDEDFLRAMEYGMPPAGGIGVGVDRLLMAITGLGVRETILFPLVKPE